jgi:hypothetical protein
MTGTSYLLTTACERLFPRYMDALSPTWLKLGSTAGFTPLYGRLADILGRGPASLLAFTLFTIGTAGQLANRHRKSPAVIETDVVRTSPRCDYKAVGLLRVCHG